MNAIERHNPETFAITSLDEAMRYSQAIADAGIVPDSFKSQPANILVAQEIAKALGESVWVTMSEMSIISGRPSFSAKFMRSRVRQAGHKLREYFDEETGTAKAVIIRSDDPDFEHTSKWNRAKAEQHGLWGKGHWKKNPELMLKNRSLSEVVREACYEVMGGVAYTPDEVQDFAPEPKQYQATRQPKAEPQAQQAPQQQGNSAQDRLASALGATPANDEDAGVWAEKIAAANSEPELMELYATASTNPRWESEIKPMFSARKQDLQQEPEQEAIDGEIVDTEAA